MPNENRKSESGEDPTSSIVERLARRKASFERYVLKDEVGRGAMGSVLRVWDEDLHRHLAMKVQRTDRPRSDALARRRSRFLEEAQVTGQLDHPGIVPVHELGVRSDGELYFTMKLVHGRTLTEVLALARSGADGWSLPRVLTVLERVCEALAYAHDRGVLHRDLKPANIMVGRYGEVYVMDWGLARVFDPAVPATASDRAATEDSVDSVIHSDRRELASSSGSPLVTEEGDVVGTPAYMSPEQAHGQLESLGPWSDVYSVGTILYHALSGGVPYVREGRNLDNYDIWQLVKERSPLPLSEVAPEAPPELVAICERAMQRRPSDRFASAKELAEELRAFLENRVVTSYRTGVWIEVRKWVRRNRGLATALAAALLILIVAIVGSAVQERDRRRVILRNLDGFQAHELMDEVDELWPLAQATVPVLEAWLADARSVVGRLPRYEAELELLEAELASEPSREFSDPAKDAEVERLRSRVAAFEALLVQKQGALSEAAGGAVASLRWELGIIERELADLRERLERGAREAAAERRRCFERPEVERRYVPQWTVVRDLRRLRGDAIPTIEQRLETSRTLREQSIENQRSRWDVAIASIADPDECPAYQGLSIEPQVGLVPLVLDERTGLWEFWHVLSGDEPRRGQDGEFVIEEETGIVLVLIPGGRFWMGGQSDDPSAPNYIDLRADPLQERAREAEQPVHAVTLAPYLLSKYELTQAQWIRLTGENPSRHFAGSEAKGGRRITRVHPVEHVSWKMADSALARWSLALPTEAQWERAARAGTETPYWSGPTFESLLGNVNFRDLSLVASGFETRVKHDDGYPVHGPADSVGVNSYGLHGVLGNVREWCRDWRDAFYRLDGIRAGDGEHVPQLQVRKACRGGGFRGDPHELRASWVDRFEPGEFFDDIGVRCARALILN